MIKMKKILIVFGTRPEAVKMAPLIKKFKNQKEKFITEVCVTAQHRSMLDQVLAFFSIDVDYDLDLMKKNQSLHELTANIVFGMQSVLEESKPDYVFVHGDTTTTMAASLSAFYSGAKVCHIEAGLRTHNKLSPFPEELNRQITTRICDYHFAPTEISKNNLLNEYINEKNIVVTGNTVIDALFESINKVKDKPSSLIKELSKDFGEKDVILVTGHRRENHGEGIQKICKALKIIAESSKNLIIVFPVHLNPNVIKPVTISLNSISNILLIEPLSYPDFIWMMNRSKIIITDSGGIQEEAPSLAKPVLVLRETTERPEAVSAGTVELVGTDTELIVSKALNLLNDNLAYESMSQLSNPYGDGMACERIINFISTINE